MYLECLHLRRRADRSDRWSKILWRVLLLRRRVVRGVVRVLKRELGGLLGVEKGICVGSHRG